MRKHTLLSAILTIVLAAMAAVVPVVAQGQKPTIKVGSTNFGEQLILAEIYAQILEANGYPVERRLNLGNREIVAPALESGQIDLYPEYLATYLTYLTKDASLSSTDAGQTHANLRVALAGKNATALDYALAVDTNGFVVTKATADRLGLDTVSDLAKGNGQLVLGGPPECPDRPFCLLGLTGTYGLQFREFRSLDAGGPITVAALEGNQIDVAVLFTTDAVIQARGFVLLRDDRRLQLADNVVPIIRNEALSQAPDEITTLLNRVSAYMTTSELTALNARVGLDRAEPREVGATWLRLKGLIQ
ncbi:MAG: L-proline glycine betaine binding transporter protein ProX [Chloroflexi bacterium]|nr:L-proline glycine betaine binding transporter protein ProX [Chloroflexota bacterium]